MKEYKHIVQYYETDKMGITHHSNYIRFMEEARTNFFEQIGWSYKKMEDSGIFSPVVSVECNFKKSTTYSDEILISVCVKDVSPAKLIVGYEMQCGGEVVCTAQSTHCFVSASGRPVAIKKISEPLYETLLSLLKN